MTIADSLVLVFGIALALSLPWYNGWVQLPQPVMEPWWRIISLFVEEPVGKASLALIPLMLYRRARLGGLCRPGELLLAVCASYGHSWAITTFWTTRRTAAREGTDSPQRSQRPPRREPSQESGSGAAPGRVRLLWTLLGDHHLLDHPSHRREGGDGFTAEIAETAEKGTEPGERVGRVRRTEARCALGRFLGVFLGGLCDLRGEPRGSIATVAAVRPVGPRWGSPRCVQVNTAVRLTPRMSRSPPGEAVEHLEHG